VHETPCVNPPTVGAARAGKLCPSFKQTGWTCASTKPWIVKLSSDRVHVGIANRATAGQCFKGTLAFPRSGFAWTAA